MRVEAAVGYSHARDLCRIVKNQYGSCGIIIVAEAHIGDARLNGCVCYPGFVAAKVIDCVGYDVVALRRSDQSDVIIGVNRNRGHLLTQLRR